MQGMQKTFAVTTPYQSQGIPERRYPPSSLIIVVYHRSIFKVDPTPYTDSIIKTT